MRMQREFLKNKTTSGKLNIVTFL